MKKKIILIVILFFVVSFFVINGTLALYRKAINPNGTIAFAKWDVSLNQNDENNHISVVPGDETSTASYTINITSLSEVDIIYTIVLNDVPQGVSVALDGGEFTAPTNNKIIFNEIGTIRYSDNNKTKSHILTFKAAQGTTYVANSEIDVNVIARQRLDN